MTNTISFKELFQSFEISGECLTRRIELPDGAKQRWRRRDENHKCAGNHVRERVEEMNTE